MRSRRDIPKWRISTTLTGFGWKTLFLAMLLLLCGTGVLLGQNRKDLEEKRKRLIEEINQITQQLDETKKSKETAMERLFALQTQVRKRQQLIQTLTQEVDYIEQSIQRSNEVLEALREDVNRLKQEYSAMLQTAYRHQLNHSFLQFVFSADSFNDAYRRWQYIRQYNSYRQRQAQLIEKTQSALYARTELLEKRRSEKQKLIAAASTQKNLMSRELDEKDKVLQNLKSDEKRLLAELDKQQKAHEQLNNAIEKIIQDEIALKKKKARTAEALSVGNNNDNYVDDQLSGPFSRQKGKLPWPVEKGSITRSFGVQPHPTLKGIKVTNNGIDIGTDPDASVFAIFEGRVAGIQFIPGFQNTVIIQHGQYYTVYSNLEEIFVRRGDGIKTKQALGKVGREKPEVHFEVWREKQRLDPIQWVGRK